jgi:hypothetical protein
VQILPKQTALFYLGVPLWAGIYVSQTDSVPVYEKPSEILSKTWWGDIFSGSLSYTVNSFLIREPDFSVFSGAYAVCPVRIRNSSQKSSFLFSRLSVYSPYLHVYSGDKNLWTNLVDVSYQSESRISIGVSNRKPEVSVTGEENLEILTRQRQHPDKNLLKKSFTVFKTITGFQA